MASRLLVHAADDPDVALDVRSRVEVTERGGRLLINALAHKYTGAWSSKNHVQMQADAIRVVVRVKADKIGWRS